MNQDTSTERRIITIDGIDGSGKSTLARGLVAALGDSAILLGVDEFRRPVDWSRTDRSQLELYYEERYDLAALDRCLGDYLEGAAGCRIDVFDSRRERLDGHRDVSFRDRRWLVVEGIFVGRLREAAGRALAVFVDVPREEVRARIVHRDVTAGRAEDEVNRRIDARYLPAHDRYLTACDPRRRAAVVIDNRKLGQPVLVRADLPPTPPWEPVRLALQVVAGGTPRPDAP